MSCFHCVSSNLMPIVYAFEYRYFFGDWLQCHLQDFGGQWAIYCPDPWDLLPSTVVPGRGVSVQVSFSLCSLWDFLTTGGTVWKLSLNGRQPLLTDVGLYFLNSRSLWYFRRHVCVYLQQTDWVMGFTKGEKVLLIALLLWSPLQPTYLHMVPTLIKDLCS